MKSIEKITEYLEKLALSEIEAKLYLTLLQKGVTSVKNLAQMTGVKRTTAYLYIDQLTEKGLVMKVVKGAQKQVAPTELANLQKLVEEKLHTAKVLQEELPNIVQVIKTTFLPTAHTDDAEIKYYKGKLGVRKIYEDALKAKELRSYFNIELIKKILPDNGVLFVEGLKNNSSIKIFELLQDTPLSREKLKKSRTFNLNYNGYSFKYLPSGVQLSAADVLIYDNHVAIVNASSDQVSGVILQDSAYYNNSKELFDLIWKVLPETS